jgi:branched-chain amino acid transport system ATP-binding protein
MPMMNLLTLKDIDTFYGSIQVHFGLNIEIPASSIVCLLGGNASGKSTTMKVILGIVKPKKGKIVLDDKDISSFPTPAIIRSGIASVPEARRIFGAMTVDENLDMGAYIRKNRTENSESKARIFELFPRLKERLRQQAGTLSGGEQQMLAIGRALMSKPRLICMDEPTMGLSPIYVDRVLEAILEINKMGIAIFMVEQNAHLALEIAHYGYVLQNGHLVLKGKALDLLEDQRIRDAYLGGNQMAGL